MYCPKENAFVVQFCKETDKTFHDNVELRATIQYRTKSLTRDRLILDQSSFNGWTIEHIYDVNSMDSKLLKDVCILNEARGIRFYERRRYDPFLAKNLNDVPI